MEIATNIETNLDNSTTNRSALDQKDYVVVNVWTSEKNEAIEGVNVGHVSLETRFGYISFWPGPRPATHKTSGLFPKVDKFFLRYFGERPSSFKKDYEEDCVAEGASEKPPREIKHIDKCKEGEKAYIFDSEEISLTLISQQPKHLKKGQLLLAIVPCKATVRMVLYGLDVSKIKNHFEGLKISGWRLIGSNFFTRNFQEKTTESCSSLAYRCLYAGGMYSKLDSKVSSGGSSVISPDALLRHVVAYKEKELEKNRETKQWKCVQCPDESSLDEVKEAYESVGQEANAERMSLVQTIFSKK